jgi:hypothetical protein
LTARPIIAPLPKLGGKGFYRLPIEKAFKTWSVHFLLETDRIFATVLFRLPWNSLIIRENTGNLTCLSDFSHHYDLKSPFTYWAF